MKSWQNILLQTAATLGQIYNVYGTLVPDKYKPYAAAVIGIVQIIAARVAHSYNPDGTPASTPFVAPK